MDCENKASQEGWADKLNEQGADEAKKQKKGKKEEREENEEQKGRAAEGE
jgi:hypothetical protein